MSQATIPLAHVQCGDRVIINKQIYSVNSMQGPDLHGAYDAYLQNDNGAYHAVITEPITVIV